MIPIAGDMSMKMDIITIGNVVNGQPSGWSFDGHGEGAAHEWVGGVMYIAGYTIEELEAISDG